MLKPEGRCVSFHLHPQGKFFLWEWWWDICFENVEEKKTNNMKFFSWLLNINYYLRLNFSFPFFNFLWATMDFEIQSEIGNQVNTCTSDFKYNLYAGNPKFQSSRYKFLSAWWTSLSEGLRLSMCYTKLSRLISTVQAINSTFPAIVKISWGQHALIVILSQGSEYSTNLAKSSWLKNCEASGF